MDGLGSCQVCGKEATGWIGSRENAVCDTHYRMAAKRIKEKVHGDRPSRAERRAKDRKTQVKGRLW